MDGQDAPEPEAKPFSVLEKFRQLKKEKEKAPPTTEEPAKAPEKSGNTVFQVSGSSTMSSNGDFGRGGFRGRGFGRFGGGRGKRPCHENTTERPSKRLAVDLWRGQSEADVGITEFIRSGPGFEVILKHRYTDFHVHEIDIEGNVTKLTSFDLPKDDEDKPSVEEDPKLLSPEEWSALKEIVEKELPGTVEKDVTDLDKFQRQRIHRAVKKRFGVHVYSNTLTKADKKIMEMGFGPGKNCKEGQRPRWKDGRPEYLHFVVHKENAETSEAIGVICKHLRVKVNKISYAGTKDKRAVTTQQMCLRRTEAERFRGVTEWRGIAVGNFAYKWNTLRLGNISGNRFKLVLRNVKASDEVITKAVESLKEVGFINYYGMQRFGQSALVPTHLVGQAILKGDWKLATELILKPRPGEATFWDVKEAREVWWQTRDAVEALKCLVRKDRSIEGKILSALKKHGPNAYQNAFDTLPHYTVTLYLHSYQSLVWNKVVSRRVRQFGLKVLPGDLIQLSDLHDLDQRQYRWENGVDASSGEEPSDDEDVGSGGKIQVKVLTAEEVETASIYDVVYPLPGDDIRLPNNEIASWYHEIMEADGHSMKAFGRVNKKYGMYGTYRKMLETVEDLNWYTQRYSDPDEDLLLSDLEILKGKPPPKSDPDGPYKAIIIEFDLKTCCYATMAIRELAKCDTSVASQAKLTIQAREDDLASKKLLQDGTEKMELDTDVKNEETVSSAHNDCTDNQVPISEEVEGRTENKAGDESKMEVESEASLNCDTQDENERTSQEQSSWYVDVKGNQNLANEHNVNQHKET